jgi:hypothetical protein
MMNLEDLEKRVIRMEDIQEIENLQRRYGYYFDTRNFQAVVDLFSDSADSADLESFGLFRGKEGIRRLYWNDIGRGGRPSDPSESWISTVVIQIGGVVNLDPSGVAARAGGKPGWLRHSCMGEPRQYWVHGYYENEYVKERGKWFFKKLFWNVTFFTMFETGWLTQPLVASCLWPTLMGRPLPLPVSIRLSVSVSLQSPCYW